MTHAIRSLLIVLAIAVLPRDVHAQSESVEYYGTDAVGSIRITFDVAGNVVGRMDYGPFGQQLLPADAMPRERFVGNTIDGESDQSYFHARQYQMRTGRFGQVDAVFNAVYEPQKWNRYTYTLGNPVAYADPTGTDPFRNVPCIGCQIPRSGVTIRSGVTGSRADDFLNGDTVIDRGAISIMTDGTFEREGRVSGRELKQRGNQTAKKDSERLSDEQCTAIGKVLQREAEYGTEVAAAMSSNTYGDDTLKSFNSDQVPNINTPVGELDVDWFTDLQIAHLASPFAQTPGVYVGFKLLWTGARYVSGGPAGNPLPFQDPGERNAVRLVWQSAHYSDIFTPAYMAKACPQ